MLDILLKERLYAAKYNELNDPMEGVVKIENSALRNREEKWEYLISDLRIVCFTKDPNNSLMWSHYADSGKGCLIEFELLDGQDYHKISYLKKPVINENNLNIDKAFEVLKYKEKPWKYEAEYRCIQIQDRFLPVSIKSITFGPRSDEDSVEMLSHILQLCKPNLKVYKMGKIGVFKSPDVIMTHTRTFVKGTPNKNDCLKCATAKVAQTNFVEKHRGYKNT